MIYTTAEGIDYVVPAFTWPEFFMAVFAVLFASYVLACMAQFIYELISVIRWNYGIAGLKGVIKAFQGYELEEILKETVTAVSYGEGAYKVYSTNGEEDFEYFAIPVSKDPDNEKYQRATELANGDNSLLKRIKPSSRVVNKVELNDKNTEESIQLCVVYLRRSTTKDVEMAFNKFFELEYLKEVKKARLSHSLVSL
jgi:hypothetical protein